MTHKHYPRDAERGLGVRRVEGNCRQLAEEELIEAPRVVLAVAVQAGRRRVGVVCANTKELTAAAQVVAEAKEQLW
jgi:hypothetical protein